MTEVAAIITISGILASVAIGAVAIAPGVSAKSSQERHLVVDHEFLGEPLGHIGVAGVVLDDEFDFLAGDHVALLLHVELGAGDQVFAGRRERAGQRHEQADLHDVLGQARSRPSA